MERELSRDDCVGLMPEWKDLDPQIESLSGGITNKLYRVRTSDGGDYVVRVFGPKGRPLNYKFPFSLMHDMSRSVNSVGLTPFSLPAYQVWVIEIGPPCSL